MFKYLDLIITCVISTQHELLVWISGTTTVKLSMSIA